MYRSIMDGMEISHRRTKLLMYVYIYPQLQAFEFSKLLKYRGGTAGVMKVHVAIYLNFVLMF